MAIWSGKAPGKIGLYDPEFERDACGVGFIASIKGVPSRKVMDEASQQVDRMVHRGASGADPLTGDGAGIMTTLPHPLFKKVAEENGWDLPAPGEYAVGNFFLNLHDTDVNHATKCKVENIAAEFGLSVIGWRVVPTDNSHIGSGAKATEPSIEQAYVKQVEGSTAFASLNFNQKLFLFHKTCTNRIPYDDVFYVCSLSSEVIVYKGQLTPEQLFLYFAGDLHHPLYKTHFALVHTRFSTNTFPSWDRAQPLRVLAHNGEINTLRGNKNWMRSREGLMKSERFGKVLEKIYPIISENGSDSAALDNVVEFLMMEKSRELPEIMMTCVPEAWENHTLMSAEKKGFYQWASLLMEAWDGPGLFCFSDARYVGAVLDRNGLRPARFYVTNDDMMIMASEVGVVEPPPHTIKQKGRLQPGRMLLVDTKKGVFYKDEDLKHDICGARPYGEWVKNNLITVDTLRNKIPSPTVPARPTVEGEGFDPRLAVFNYTREHLHKLLIPMILNRKEALGSMGNDAALACMSKGPRLMFDYFKQLFAQVTNPPIDPFREAIVMSLKAGVGPQGNLLDHSPEQCKRITLDNPVLRTDDLARIQGMSKVAGWEDWKVVTVDTTFEKSEGPEGLKKCLDRLCTEVAAAVADGAKFVVLSDRAVGPARVPAQALLAVGAVHQSLVAAKKRLQIGLILESGEAREVHHMCTLVGFGCDAICPYVVFETMFELREKKEIYAKEEVSDATIMDNYVAAIDMGMRKVMAKMGISTLLSYKGAQIFEAVGVGKEVVDMCFTGTASRLGGVNFECLGKEALMCHNLAYPPREGVVTQPILQDHGDYHFRTGGVDHVNDPVALANLQDAARNKNKAAYATFSKAHDEQVRKCCLRGLLDFRAIDKHLHVPIEEVEPAANIVKRFATGAMSYGSISDEAHRTLAIAMNRMGAKSNTGEGGEDPNRWVPKENGDSEKSAIKQVASGRFGVTIAYLGAAIEIQIKMAQGAKPGEGGELPGQKVTKGIGATRHSTPGVGLISPPPHHDIYSIEDLAQLIYDLKCANPEARVSVKLVSEVGVGVIASGVTKGHADHITISGHDGGTGASSWTGVKHAGLPWELGIAETHQTLVLNNLRGRVVLQTDGQLRTGRDIVIASMLGADEFGLSTAPLIVMGCTMMRKCHLNTCPVGIATQDPVLRKKFDGAPEHVVNYFFMMADEIRQYMSKCGFRTMEEMTGRSDMLVMNDTIGTEKTKLLDLSDMLMPAFQVRMGVPTTPCQKQDHGLHLRVDYKIITRVRHSIQNPNLPSHIEMNIRNVDRDFGTTLSYEVNKCTNGKGLPDDTIHIKAYGSAGQSLGAYLCKGITIEVVGDSNDYVGKGLSGGKVIVYPAQYDPSFKAEENIVVGNVCLYGATSGNAYFNGIAAERFCVRNSGATAVVEGVGDHGCEYMTGGRTIVLGSTGRNFAAGMSGGIAYVLDEAGDFKGKCNMEMVSLVGMEDSDSDFVKDQVTKHVAATGSAKGARMLEDWASFRAKFVKVYPNDFRRVMEENAAEEARREEMAKNKFIKKQAPKPVVKDIEDISALNKTQGFMKYARKPDPYRPVQERVKDFSELTKRHDPDNLKIQAARCMDCGVPFCQTTATGCPLGNIIPTWNDLVFKGKYKEALYTLLSTNSFPEFTGRVCPAPCEGACVLGINADPVSIKSIECAIIDKAFEEGWMKPQIPVRTGKTVAIIGSGPAGMAAAHQLNNAGHKVTVYERAPKFGGLCYYGIPNMKLEKSVVDRRVELMRQEGVEWVANANVGVNVDVNELLAKNDALVLANGATYPRNLPIKGRDLQGIHFAMDFLGVNPDKINASGRKVLVIGGGDTGNDCIGTSLRQGASSIVSFEIMPQPPNGRAKENPWPQWPRIFRVDYGHAEVKEMMGQDPRSFSILTKEFVSDDNGRVAACKTVNVEWTKNESGQFAMKEVPGSERTWECDLVLLAMGFLGPESIFTEQLKLETDPRSNYKTPPGQYRTSIPKVYAAGDCRRGQSLVVWAINEGRQCAREVDADLQGAETTPLAVTGGIVKIHS